MTMLRAILRPALAITVALSALTGLAYPGLVTALAHALFPAQAAGSFVHRDGQPVGSSLIGQGWTRPGYFHGRPSAAGAGYDAAASGGRNKGPTDRILNDSLIPAAVEHAVQWDGARRGTIPADLVTASASGLDPEISPASAALQVPRVARARGLPESVVTALVQRHTRGRQFRLFGEPRVNVLLLNLALDSASTGR